MADEAKGIGYSAFDATAPRKKVKIGMLGRGFMGKAHSNAYKKIDYLFETNFSPELVAIGATTLENAKNAAARYGFEKAYEGWKAVIDDPDVEVVDNVMAAHEESCIYAAEKGKAIICEKPMVAGKEAGKRMLEAVKKAGVKNAVTYNYRFMPSVRLAYDLIRKGAIGDIIHFYGRYHQSYGLPLDAPAKAVWYQNQDGNAQGLCTHLIDQARFLMNTEVATIFGDVRNVPGRPHDDRCSALVEFANGATGTLENSSLCYGKWNELFWEVYGTKGMISFNLEDVAHLIVDVKNPDFPELNGQQRISVTQPGHPFMDVWWPAGHNTGWEHGHINLLAHVLDCIVNDKDIAPLCATFEDGYRVAAVVEAMEDSSKQGKKIDIEY